MISFFVQCRSFPLKGAGDLVPVCKLDCPGRPFFRRYAYPWRGAGAGSLVGCVGGPLRPASGELGTFLFHLGVFLVLFFPLPPAALISSRTPRFGQLRGAGPLYAPVGGMAQAPSSGLHARGWSLGFFLCMFFYFKIFVLSSSLPECSSSFSIILCMQGHWRSIESF